MPKSTRRNTKARSEMPIEFGLLASSVLFVQLPKSDRLLMLRMLWRLIPLRSRLSTRLEPARKFAPKSFEFKAGAR